MKVKALKLTEIHEQQYKTLVCVFKYKMQKHFIQCSVYIICKQLFSASVLS